MYAAASNIVVSLPKKRAQKASTVIIYKMQPDGTYKIVQSKINTNCLF